MHDLRIQLHVDILLIFTFHFCGTGRRETPFEFLYDTYDDLLTHFSAYNWLAN